MNRLPMAGVGVALVALLGVGVVAGGGVFAQNATPAAGTSGSTTATTYQDFVGKLAANLGISDPTKVDAAIKTALKQMVDEQLTAGHISADQANAAKQAIDNGQFGGDLLGLGQSGPNDNRQERGNGGNPENGND